MRVQAHVHSACASVMCMILTGVCRQCHDESQHYFTLTQNGQTALMVAASGGHTSVVTLLLDAKADVNLADNVRYSFCKSCRECSSEYVREHSDMTDVVVDINIDIDVM